uniref:Histone-lysine N-methyltransferase n=1 Tax=Daucus carota subsp. sativus TaxID=79200 RepID=A0A175YHQ5_DAUCS
MNVEDMEEIGGAPPLKYVPLREVYDATAPARLNTRNSIHDSKLQSNEEFRKSKRRRVKSTKMIESQMSNSAVVVGLASAAPTDCNINKKTKKKKKKKSGDDVDNDKKDVLDVKCKKWTRLRIDADYKRFIGLKCKASTLVHWPLDDDWYYGHIVGYDPVTGRHHIKYKDGDEEHLILPNERISFYVSPKEMQQLKLSYGVPCPDSGNFDICDTIALAATLDDCCDRDPSPGDMIWAQITGHFMWPAVVLDESASSNLKGLNKISGEKSFLVQFFCTHDFARLSRKQVIPFLIGLLSDFHLKCKKSDFMLSLVEAKMYLSIQKLPNRMLSLRKSNTTNNESASGEEEGIAILGDKGSGDEEIHKKLVDIRSCPFEIGDLKIISLDPNKLVSYKMEVLRDVIMLNKPLFRVTSEEEEQFEGPTSSSCWDKVYRKLWKMNFCSDALKENDKSGPEMFGFSDPEILKLIQFVLIMWHEQLSSTSKLPSEFKSVSKRGRDLPVGYRIIHITWKDLDKCNVCHMDEVHTRCYGEHEPVNGILWYCNLCRSGAPESPPPCCLCPVTGGAMKHTTDGRWAHLACAIWIPETCLVDFRKMEPIDGLNKINKCSNNSCYVAYHPLCARAAGFCLEREDEDRLHMIPGEEDDGSQCIRLLSYCKRHRPASNQRTVVNIRIGENARQQSDYIPTPNPSGCARTEPYNYLGRRGRKEPEACGTVSLKRLYVENRPYLVGGFSQHKSLTKVVSSQCVTSKSIFSMAEKYSYMKKTFRKRLAFGKSGIHGYGIFAKQQHFAGDMVIEYIGELVRAPIADRREHLIYNSFVPNCYSRVITVNGDEHIIIFSKRDIKQWEELTYDYRFLSIDEQLACYCGFPRCRGVVNDVDAEERIAKLCVPRRDLTAESTISGKYTCKSSLVTLVFNMDILSCG